MPPLKAQLLLAESLAAYFPEMVFTDSGITVQIHRNTQKRGAPNAHYVQLPISHGKTDTQVEIRLLYRVLAHSNPQGRAFAA